MTLCIVGGGVAGLAAAHYALKVPAYQKIVLLEASDRLGGWVRTIRNKDGVIMEKGPRTIRPAGAQGANTLALVQELGLEDAVRPVTYSHPAATNRMILVNGRLHTLPNSFWSLFRTLPPFTRPLAMAALTDLTTGRVKCEDTSLHEFVSRRLGSELADYAVSSVVRGICAGDSKQVSVHFIAKYLHQCEQETGRIFLGVARDWCKGCVTSPPPCPEESLDIVRRARSEHWSIWGLENGLETLTDRMRETIVRAGVEVQTGASVRDIVKDGDRLIVRTEAGGKVGCDHVVCAAPAHQTAPMLHTLSPELASILSQVPFVDVAVVNIQYKGRVLNKQGFGFLVPSSQPEPILGCIYDTCTFPQGARTVLTVMMGGAWYRQMIGTKSPDQVQRLAVEQVSRILNIDSEPVRCDTSLLPQCIAQYTVGHQARLAKARAIIQSLGVNLDIVGSSYDGPGINDTIMSAKRSVIVSQ